jgi:MEMO1 family protein
MPPTRVVRAPAVAGRFYPGQAEDLSREVARHLGEPQDAQRALGVVAPHAGYIYSGALAGKTFARVQVPQRVIVLGPNHTGLGSPVSVIASGAFQLPGAEVPIDDDLAAAILKRVPGARHDPRAHEREHAIEVELPFLLAQRGTRTDLRFVPIVLGSLDGDRAIAVGRGLAKAIDDAGGDVLVVASSDMSHYLSDADARRRDRPAIDRILALDPEGLYRVVDEQDISMCGILPVTAMLACAREHGAARADLVGYATSGDAFGDTERVVGYAGVVVT